MSIRLLRKYFHRLRCWERVDSSSIVWSSSYEIVSSYDIRFVWRNHQHFLSDYSDPTIFTVDTLSNSYRIYLESLSVGAYVNTITSKIFPLVLPCSRVDTHWCEILHTRKLCHTLSDSYDAITNIFLKNIIKRIHSITFSLDGYDTTRCLYLDRRVFGIWNS